MVLALVIAPPHHTFTHTSISLVWFWMSCMVQMMVSVSANYLNTIGRHLRAKEVEHANGQGRFRRTATFTVDTVNNACDSCVQAGNFWNGIACVNQVSSTFWHFSTFLQ